MTQANVAASRFLNSRRLKLDGAPDASAASNRLTIPEFAPTEAPMAFHLQGLPRTASRFLNSRRLKRVQ